MVKKGLLGSYDGGRLCKQSMKEEGRRGGTFHSTYCSRPAMLRSCSWLDFGRPLSRRYNKLSLDGSRGEDSKFDKVDPEMSLLPGGLQPVRSESEQHQTETPAILSLMKDNPSPMSSSLFLSSIHARRMSRGDDTSAAARSLAEEGGAWRGRRGSEQQAGVVDEVSAFRQSGSGIINSKKITAVSMGTNHTAFLTGELQLSSASLQILSERERERERERGREGGREREREPVFNHALCKSFSLSKFKLKVVEPYLKTVKSMNKCSKAQQWLLKSSLYSSCISSCICRSYSSSSRPHSRRR